jgi:patatin-like phospholipase/acyl hydrolase
MSYRDKERAAGPKKLLALDGGGIRGVITLEVLAAMENMLRSELGGDSSFVLGDYFDYIAGTSTGAVIGAGLARGMPVSELMDLYISMGSKMFKKAFWPQRLWNKYRADPLTAELQRVFGAATVFGDPSLRTLLLMVLRNASTDSTWPLANNTGAKYNNPDHPDCNLKLPLWQLVRGSAAAPVYFPPEEINLGHRKFVFVDGGVTPYNDPAFQLFLMATMKAYGLGWPTGEENMLLVSIGTGFSPKANENLKRSRMHVIYNTTSLPAAMMFGAMNQQDMLCRVFGRCLAGHALDREVGDLRAEDGPVAQKLFTYVRYNVELSREGLDALGLTSIKPQQVMRLDSVEHVRELRAIGQALARRDLFRKPFESFL